MSRVVISGYYGFDNLGDEAVLAGTIEALRCLRPDIEIAVLSANPEPTARAHGVRAIPRDRPADLLHALRQCDLCLSGGGSLFQDATSWRSPWYYLGVLALAQRLGRPTAVYAQGIGPLRGRVVRRTAARLLDAVQIITLRDQASLAVLDRWGVRRPPIALAADPALLLRPEWSPRVMAERSRWGGGRCFGLALRSWADDRWLEALAGAARAASRRFDARWICLSMHPSNDLTTATRVAAEIGAAATVVRGPFTPCEMLALTGDLALLVGMRLHALIFAALLGVPLVALAYDPKITAFAREVGEPCLDLDAPDFLRLGQTIASAAESLPERRARLLAAVAPIKARAALAPRLVANLLS